MKILTTIPETRQELRTLRAQEGRIALVPTMGALHAGHLSLVARAKAEADIVVASIFVNPLQFGPAEDFARYPRQLECDAELLASAGVDLLFAPAAAEITPPGATAFVDPGPLGDRLDGAHRPGHFRGVATIVAKLFHIVQPDIACFGQKDAVQVAVLRQMVRDLNFPVDLIACPIVRDPDGLALSSRNAYLTPGERQTALALPHALSLIRASLPQKPGCPIHPRAFCEDGWDVPCPDNRLPPERPARDAKLTLAPARAFLAAQPNLALEYLEAVHPDTLLPVAEIAPGTLFAVAARVGTTRLIDNFLA
jgi:pantoate--beta-alanine ligase